MKVIEQPNEYSCGSHCIQFLLGLHGINVSIEEIEKEAGTNADVGTTHTGIKKVFQNNGMNYLSYYDSHISTLQEFIPCIINYQYCDEEGCDGHYSVVLGVAEADKSFIIYNPYTGEIEFLSFEYLEKNWYSERFGNQWFLHVIKREEKYNL